MERATHIIILTLISCFEIWMCYQILYRTVLEKRYLQTWQKILIWGNILGMGIVLGVNRGIFFLSSAILWLCIFYTIVVAVILNVKRWHLIVEIVGIYYLFVALLDLFFAFCGIAIGNDFYQVFSAYNYSGEKCILFILSRISIISILIFLKKERKGEIIVEKAQTFMLVTMGILVVIVTGYHFLIYDILNGLSDVSGWSGLLLLTTMIQANQKLKRVEEIQTALKKQVFQYTDNGLVSLNHLQSQNTGAYTGEGSLIYAYLNLYRLTNEKVYLQYAVKHAGIVSQILEEDSCSDLLGGKAGAAWVFLQLYQETQNQRYIQEAERAICLMLPQMIKTECGVGWNPESVDVPIGGMAHGNAGILMPVLVLWELTKKKEYGWLAEKIWEYEESLYREETGNWMDIRDHSDEGEDTVAWCHGAAGILLSRLWCYEKITDSKWKKRLKKDIDRGYQKTSAFWKRDSWSLCHGNSGNLWILNLADQVLGKKRKERGNYEKIRLLPQERMNPGLMGGYGGVLLHLLVKLIR